VGALYRVDALTGKARTIWSYILDGGQKPPTLGPLTYAHGMFYSTTQHDGPNSDGTVFEFDPRTNTQTTIYAFKDGEDGSSPFGTLTYAKGALYGVTAAAVFRIDTSTGTETTLYKFTANSPTGPNPNGSLLYKDGALYGTTYGTYPSPLGAIFKIDLKTRQERAIYRFKGKADGLFPAAGLIFENGAFYGTTAGQNGSNYVNPGTVFKFDP
jgi:uncharacterized repeat protein (TIGR03803 family)